MSINIQLDGKLQKISGQTMTKEKIVEKLGYTPADEATVNANIAELNSNLDVLEGALEEHKNSMSDIDAGSADDELVVADQSGRVIAKIDDEGLHTTNVEADAFISRDDNLIINDTDGNKIFQVDVNGVRTTKLELNSGDVDEQLKGLSARIAEVENDIPEIPVTSVNGKTGAVELEYRDLKNAPAIEAEEDEDSLIVTDGNGNIVLRAGNLDESDDKITGIETTEIILKGGKVDERIVQLNAGLSEHTNKADIHITKTERDDWNARATTKYVDDAIAGIVNSAPEVLNTLDELAAALGDDANFATTITDELSKKALQSDLAAHTADINSHVTSSDRAKWNDKSYSSLIGAPAISEEPDSKELTITDEDGRIVMRVGELDEKGTTGLETTTVRAKAILINVDNNDPSKDIDIATALNNRVTNDVLAAELSNKVDTSRKINNKALDKDITLTAADVGALPADTTIPSIEGFITAGEVDSKVGSAVAAHAADGAAHASVIKTATDNLKAELSESIVSESDSWSIVDEAGNIMLEAGEVDLDDGTPKIGLKTTFIKAKEASIENIYNKSEVEALVAAIEPPEDIFETDMKTINDFGGIAANTDLNGLTTHEILRKLLYPYIDATVGNATASPNGGTYEKGVTKTITQVSITITKKSEPITSVALYNGATLIEEKTGDAVKNGGTITFTGLNIVVPTDGNRLTVKVTYPDASGNAKTVEKKTTAMTFVYPYYMGAVASGVTIDEATIEALKEKKVESKGNKSYGFDLSDAHIVFAYPAAHGALKSIIDPNGYETISGYTRTEISITGLDGSAQIYYVYKSNDAATASGFTVNFKY